MARDVADRITDTSSLSVLSTIFLAAHFDADAEKALTRYLKADPTGDANAWADLAKLQHRTGRRPLAQQSFIQGYKIDGRRLFDRVNKEPELYEIAAPLFKRR